MFLKNMTTMNIQAFEIFQSASKPIPPPQNYQEEPSLLLPRDSINNSFISNQAANDVNLSISTIATVDTSRANIIRHAVHTPSSSSLFVAKPIPKQRSQLQSQPAVRSTFGQRK